MRSDPPPSARAVSSTDATIDDESGPVDDDRRSAGSFVQSLERGLSVIKAFGTERPEMTLSEVAAVAGLTRAAARRFLLTLVTLNYVHFDGRYFSLRPRVLELGYSFLSSMSLPEIALPHMEKLVATVQESVSVSILDDSDIVYVARVPTNRIMKVSINVGTRFPAYATSMGRVLLADHPDEWIAEFLSSRPLEPLTDYTLTDPAALLAEFQQVREQGWAVVDQELEEGLRSIAAPLRDASGHAVAAINVSVSARLQSRLNVESELLPPLLEAADAITSDLRVPRF
jgi:IclR family pca regulon transcriptional regulator